jgi:hypothetical protein
MARRIEQNEYDFFNGQAEFEIVLEAFFNQAIISKKEFDSLLS